MEQVQRFAFEIGAKEFFETEGRRLGYGEPYCGGDGWWKCVRYVEAAAPQPRRA